MPYVVLPSHFSWQAQLVAWFSPTLYDEISDIPLKFKPKGRGWIDLIVPDLEEGSEFPPSESSPRPLNLNFPDHATEIEGPDRQNASTLQIVRFSRQV